MLDVELTLDVLEFHGLLRLGKRTGDWYTAYCPFHSGGQERRPSFGVLVTDQYKGGQHYPRGFSHCFACGYAGDFTTTITRILESKSIKQTGLEWLSQNIPGYAPDLESDDLIPAELFDQVTSKFAISAIEQKTMSFVSEEELASYRFTVPYMYDRKLTDDVIELYDIGFDQNWVPPGRKKPVPCITIPIRDKQGRTLFFCRRSINGKLYNYPEGVTKPVFGLDVLPKECRSVVVCESAINAMTAHVYGYDAVALLGTGNTYQKQQMRELGIKEFVLAFDGDEAGRKAAKKWKGWLRDIAVVWTITMPEGKDVNDVSKDEFDQLYRERE